MKQVIDSAWKNVELKKNKNKKHEELFTRSFSWPNLCERYFAGVSTALPAKPAATNYAIYEQKHAEN